MTDQGGNSQAASAGSRVWKTGTLVYGSSGLALLFCWLLWGDFAWSIKERSVPAIVQLLLRHFGASDFWVGLLIGSLPAVLTMVLVPTVSYRSDRYRSRWGRRIPFLAWSTPVAVFSILGLAFCPEMGAQLHAWLGSYSPGLNLCVLISFGVFWTMFEMVTVTANAVFIALINDVVPVAWLGRFNGLFRAVSLIVGMLFNYWLLGKAEEYYRWIFGAIGLIYGVGFTLMCLKVKEGSYPEVPGRSEPLGFSRAAATYFRECFKHSFYRWVFLAVNLPAVAFVPMNVFSFFFAKQVGMSMADFGKCLALTYFISMVLAYFLGMCADRFHPIRVGLVIAALYTGLTLWGGFFATEVRTFAIAVIAHGVLSGCWLTGTASLGQRLFPQAKFAQLASAQLGLLSLATIVVAPLTGWFLDITGHTYRYAFLIGCGLVAAGSLAMLCLLKKFKELGGEHSYVAPPV